jgi:hypothetical protein
MKLIRTIASYLLVAALVACGGGGGSPGTVSTASGSTATGTSP